MDLEQFVENNKRKLPIFLLLDTIGSMSGENISVLNQSVRQMVETFRSEHLSEVTIEICVITFGGTAQVSNDLAPIDKFEYNDLRASGNTPLGGALRLAREIINDKERVTSKGYKPTIVLASDGHPNDYGWENELNIFLTDKRASKCERWALTIGGDCNHQMLSKFVQGSTGKVFEATFANQIAQFFKFVTMSTSVRAASQNPNASINLDEIREQMDIDMPTYGIDL